MGEGGEEPAQPAAASVVPGWDFRRKKRRRAVEEPEAEQEPQTAVVQPVDQDAPLREFIARQKPRDKERFVPAAEPEPQFTVKPDATAKRRRLMKIMLLLHPE